MTHQGGCRLHCALHQTQLCTLSHLTQISLLGNVCGKHQDACSGFLLARRWNRFGLDTCLNRSRRDLSTAQMVTTASSLKLLPAEISDRIYAYVLISDAPFRVCQISNLLSVFDNRAVEKLRLMTETWDSYQFSGYSYDEADEKKESMVSAIVAFVVDPLLMSTGLQNFSFLRRATTIYVANAAPPEMQSSQPISSFDGPNRAHVVFPGLLATFATLGRQAAPIFYANNTFNFDDIETAPSYLVNLERCYRSHIRICFNITVLSREYPWPVPPA